jgi:hypothetical protein
LAHQTEPSTFRIDTTLLEQLKLEAERKQINLNVLVNQILKFHVEWHVKAAMAGYVPIRKALVRAVIDSLTEEQINNIGNIYSRDLLEATLIITGEKPSSESIFELLDKWVKASGFEYHREMDKENDRMVYVIQHNIGMNWSRLLALVLGQAASLFTGGKPDFVAADNTLFIALNSK